MAKSLTPKQRAERGEITASVALDMYDLENEQLRICLGAALKDSDRLDWMDNKQPDVEHSRRHGGWIVTDENAVHPACETVREAIDQARDHPVSTDPNECHEHQEAHSQRPSVAPRWTDYAIHRSFRAALKAPAQEAARTGTPRRSSTAPETHTEDLSALREQARIERLHPHFLNE